MADDQPALYDLGILFVHGIGQNRRGDTLLQCGEPLRACVEDLLAPPTTGSPANPAGHVTIASASLVAQGDAPAHAELEIAMDPAGESRWLLAEAWWAEVFPPPTFREIASWCFEVVPWTLLAHFDRRFRRLGFRVAHAINRRPVREVVSIVWRWLWEGAALLLALTLVPIAVCLLAALLVLALVPIGAVREMVGTIQRTLAGTLGDSYVFTRQPLVVAAILAHVRANLEWLAARCRRVAIVAHSQGGAVCHELLRGWPEPCDLLITYGSGLGKLADLEGAAVARGRAHLWMATAGAVTAAAGFIAQLLGAWQLAPDIMSLLLATVTAGLVAELGVAFLGAALLADPEASKVVSSGRLLLRLSAFVVVAVAAIALLELTTSGLRRPFATLAPTAVMAGGLALSYAGLRLWHGAARRSLHARQQWLLDRQRFHDRFELKNRSISWYDIYASADPVPNGSLLDDYLPDRLISVEVSNLHSLVWDHNTYWKGGDFVPYVAELLLKHAGVTTPARDLRLGRQRRRWRVGWLVASRRVLSLLALGLAVSWASRTPHAIEVISRVFREAGASPAGLWANPLTWVAVIWALACQITGAAWQAWDRKETALTFLGTRSWPFEARFWVFLTIVATAATAGLWALGGFVPVLVAVVALALVGLALVSSSRLRSWLERVSAAGSPERVKELQHRHLTSQLTHALRRADTDELTWLGRQLESLDPAAATRAWSRAIELGSANAAWLLGRHAERKEDGVDAPDAKQLYRREAIDAFQKGSDLRDPVCARWLAWAHERAADPAAAEQAYRLAFDLGDDMAAHSLGLALQARGLTLDARLMFEEGVRRKDRLSAQFLAEGLEGEAHDLDGIDKGAAARLRAQALDLYRTAFALGHAGAAASAGNLFRKQGDVAAARRAYRGGIQHRVASCALMLGQLEDEEEQNDEAATAAYALAITMDAHGHVAAEARYRLGGLLEHAQRPRAAQRLYREAMKGSSTIAAAQSAVALGQLLEKDGGYSARMEARAAYFRAAELVPLLGAEPLAQFLVGNHDVEGAREVYQRGTKDYSPKALLEIGRLLERSEPAAARELYEAAMAQGSTDAAFRLYEAARQDGNPERAQSVLDQATKLGPDFADSLTRILAERSSSNLDHN